MKQNPERPRSGSRPAAPLGLGRFAVEPRLSTPLNDDDDGACAPLFLPAAAGVGRNGDDDDIDGGNEVLAGGWALRPVVGSPPKNPASSRSSWNMSTNTCCSSSKVSCTYTERFGQRADLDARGTLQQLVRESVSYYELFTAD